MGTLVGFFRKDTTILGASLTYLQLTKIDIGVHLIDVLCIQSIEHSRGSIINDRSLNSTSIEGVWTLPTSLFLLSKSIVPHQEQQCQNNKGSIHN